MNVQIHMPTYAVGTLRAGTEFTFDGARYLLLADADGNASVRAVDLKTHDLCVFPRGTEVTASFQGGNTVRFDTLAVGDWFLDGPKGSLFVVVGVPSTDDDDDDRLVVRGALSFSTLRLAHFRNNVMVIPVQATVRVFASA